MATYNQKEYNDILFNEYSDSIYKGYYADILLYVEVDKSYAADILLSGIGDHFYNSDVDLQGITNSTYSAEVILQTQNIDKIYSADIILQTENDISHNADIDLQDTSNLSYSADILLEQTYNISYSADLFMDRISIYSADIYTESGFTPADWPNSRDVVINPDDVVDNPHTDFPVLLILEAGGINDDWGDLATTLFADVGFIKADAARNIIFTDATGTIKYAHEIAYFSNTVSKKYIECYIKIPSLTVATHIKMLHRTDGVSDEQRVTQVWSNDYAGVWHLTEQNDGTAVGDVIYFDSTLNDNDAKDYISDITKPEKLGLSQQFDGVNDYVSHTNTTSLQIGNNDFTLSAWVKSSDTELTEKGIICKDSGGSGNGWSWFVGNANKPVFFLETSLSYKTADTIAADDDWHYLMAQRNNDGLYFYQDGAADGSYSNFFAPFDLTNTNDLVFGLRAGNFSLDGSLDEIRIATTTREDGWVETEYNSQNNNESFWYVGPGEATVRGTSYSSDVDIQGVLYKSAYNADVYIREPRYILVEELARQVMALNSDNRVNIIGFNTDYIEIILIKDWKYNNHRDYRNITFFANRSYS